MIQYRYPSDGSGWRGRESSLPNGVDGWKESALNSSELTNASTDNGSYVTHSSYYPPPSGPWQYGGLIFEIPITAQPLTQLDVFLNMYDAGGESTTAQVWNWNTSSWEVVQSHTGGAAGEYNLTRSITSTPGDYRSAGNLVRVLVYTSTAGASVRLDQLKLTVTYQATENVGTIAKAVTGRTDMQRYCELALATLVLALSGLIDLQRYDDHVGTMASALTGIAVEKEWVAETVGGLALALTGAAEQQHYHELQRGGLVEAVGGVSDLLHYADQVGTSARVVGNVSAWQHYLHLDLGMPALVLTGIAAEKEWVAEAVGGMALALTGESDTVVECQGTIALALTGIETEHWTRTDHVGTMLETLNDVLDQATYSAEPVGTIALAISDVSDAWRRADHVGTVAILLTEVSDDARYKELGCGTLAHALSGVLDGMAADEARGTVAKAVTAAVGLHIIPYGIAVPDAESRELTWSAPLLTEGTAFWVVADGRIVHHTTDRVCRLTADLEVRQYLQVIAEPGLTESELLAWLRTPRDVVRCAWTAVADAVEYRVYRKLGGGAYELITTLPTQLYDDGPLPDGVYTYQVHAVDEEGDIGVSVGRTAIVSSAPEPPASLSYTWTPATKTLRISWSASPSADVVSYRVRSNGGSGPLDPASAPVQESVALYYERAFTNETGLFIWSVRAVDGDGNEDANIARMLALAVVGGNLVARPAVPRLVDATAVEDGRICVDWLYEPHDEENGPGAGQEARVYWDAGTGTVSYAAPYAVLSMGGPSSATRYDWTSGPLTNEQEYRFVVRVATAAWPAGLETSNTDEHSATADSDQPASPELTVGLI